MPSRFEADSRGLAKDLDAYVDEVFEGLESDFLVLPKGPGFIEYPLFERAYEALKAKTTGFRDLDPAKVLDAVQTFPLTFVVLRGLLGFTPPEWAYVTTTRTEIEVPQGAARTIDRNVRLKPEKAVSKGKTLDRIRALVRTACELLQEGAPTVAADRIHRLNKADTAEGVKGVQSLADMGVPYAMLLYERFLGRPFAGHRDSVSELVGDVLENGIEDVLSRAGIGYRKTKRAERVAGFDQAPDFIVPDEFNPKVVIEAKVTEDDGTARDKVTRVQHLATLATKGGKRKFQVVACISGRGFGVRREDMKKLLLATEGRVFTLQDMNRLVSATDLAGFKTR